MPPDHRVRRQCLDRHHRSSTAWPRRQDDPVSDTESWAWLSACPRRLRSTGATTRAVAER